MLTVNPKILNMSRSICILVQNKSRSIFVYYPVSLSNNKSYKDRYTFVVTYTVHTISLGSIVPADRITTYASNLYKTAVPIKSSFARSLIQKRYESQKL